MRFRTDACVCAQVDASNPRKGGSLFGVRERSERLHALVPLAALLHLPFLLAFACRIGTLYTLSWLAAVLSVNWTYNFGPHLSSRYAPLDLFCPCGYLLVIPLSCALNMLPLPPLRCWIHTLFFVVRSQLWIQTFDVCCDARAGRRTSAVILGLRRSRILLALILVGETLFVYTQFYDWALRSFSFASIILLALQVWAVTVAQVAPHPVDIPPVDTPPVDTATVAPLASHHSRRTPPVAPLLLTPLLLTPLRPRSGHTTVVTPPSSVTLASSHLNKHRAFTRLNTHV